MFNKIFEATMCSMIFKGYRMIKEDDEYERC